MQVQVDYRAPETFDMVAMAQLIDAAVNQKPAGLVVSIPDASALGPSIKKAVAAGIPVISMNSGSDVSKKLGALLHVGQDEFDAGKIAGAKLKEMGGKVALCVNQEVGNVALDLRCKGFSRRLRRQSDGVAGLERSDRRARQGQGSARRRCFASTPSWRSAPAQPASRRSPPSRMRARPARSRSRTFDLSASFLKAVAAGEAAFAIDQQQFLQGYLPVVFLANYAKYGLDPGRQRPSGPNLITKDKAAQVVELSAKGIR